jgi:sugar-specific transcriptional regulator TrmB
MIENILEKIGLTKGEIKVYLALLEIGSTSVGEIIKKSGISGSKTYEVIDKLIIKGLVNYMIKNGVKYFEATSPERILDYLEEKEKSLDLDKREILKAIPELLLKQKRAPKAEVKIYTGFEGAKVVWEDLINGCKKGDEVFNWGLTEQPESWESYFNEREKFRDKKGIKMRMILNEKYRSLYHTRKDFPNTRFRFFPKELEMPTSVVVWKNNVVLYIITKENPLTIVIGSEATANSFRKYFEILWKQAKKP